VIEEESEAEGSYIGTDGRNIIAVPKNRI